jgi:hypothetical protein
VASIGFLFLKLIPSDVGLRQTFSGRLSIIAARLGHAPGNNCTPNQRAALAELAQHVYGIN